MEASTPQRVKGTFIADYPVDKMSVHPRNPRIGDVGKIAESLRKHGQARPIVIDTDGVILAGNHTFKAAKEVGWDAVDVYQMNYDYDTAVSFLVADNRLSDLGTYDDDELVSLLTELMEADNLAGTGFTPDDVDDILVGAGEVPDAAPGTGSQQHTEEATAEHWNRDVGGGAPSTPLKDVTLNYPEEEFALFEKGVKKLQKDWGIASTRGVVLECVKRQAGIKSDEAPAATEPEPPADPAPDEAPVSVEDQAAPAPEAAAGVTSAAADQPEAEQASFLDADPAPADQPDAPAEPEMIFDVLSGTMKPKGS